MATMHGDAWWVYSRPVGPNHSEDPRYVFHMREDIYCRAAEASLANLRAALAVQASTLAATVGSDRDSITGPSPHIHSPRTVMLK